MSKKYRIIELILVALLIGFIVYLFIAGSGGTDKRVKEIAELRCLYEWLDFL